MERVVKIETSRDSYDIRESMAHSMTIEELIDELHCYPMDAKVVFSNDNGYTYGVINCESICQSNVKTYEEEREEEEKERREEEEWNECYEIVEKVYEDNEEIDYTDKTIYADMLFNYMREQGLIMDEVKENAVQILSKLKISEN